MMGITYPKPGVFREGFTLIELLIVVAIIAILAAIAVPNFMEAQVRAKVSRVRSDHRTMATAIEAYTTDYLRPPLGIQEVTNMSPQPISGPFPLREYWCQSKLTTPVAYLSSVLLDPFYNVRPDKDGRHMYVYHAYMLPEFSSGTSIWAACRRLGYTWATMSRGPVPTAAQSSWGMQHIITGTRGGVYDSTNGTNSEGALVRTNKGVFNGVPGQ